MGAAGPQGFVVDVMDLAAIDPQKYYQVRLMGHMVHQYYEGLTL